MANQPFDFIKISKKENQPFDFIKFSENEKWQTSLLLHPGRQSRLMRSVNRGGCQN